MRRDLIFFVVGMAVGFGLSLGLAFAEEATTAIITSGTDNCVCQANGKTWPCHKVRGSPSGALDLVNRCHGGGYQLSCPADPAAVCQWVMVSPTCTEPPLQPICWAGDEPR